jgi:hypothetical protein
MGPGFRLGPGRSAFEGPGSYGSAAFRSRDLPAAYRFREAPSNVRRRPRPDAARDPAGVLRQWLSIPCLSFYHSPGMRYAMPSGATAEAKSARFEEPCYGRGPLVDPPGAGFAPLHAADASRGGNRPSLANRATAHQSEHGCGRLDNFRLGISQPPRGPCTTNGQNLRTPRRFPHKWPLLADTHRASADPSAPSAPSAPSGFDLFFSASQRLRGE